MNFNYVLFIFLGGPTSSRLLQTQLPVRPQQECVRAFQNFKGNVIDDRVLCSGYSQGGKDSCQVRNDYRIILIKKLIKNVYISYKWLN